MALNFGKVGFSVSFNPTSAFPIDARSYFESLEAAQLAAASAKPVGSKDSVYYYGQTLVVVENNLATFYMIQTDGTLVSVGGNGDAPASITVNPKQFEYDEFGNLSLKGFDEAEVNSLLSIGADGTLTYVQPIDAYTKEETDEKIAEAVANAAHMKRKIVSSVKDIEDYMAEHTDADQYIYMVPTGLATDSDRYDEYIVLVITDGEDVSTKYVEKVGSWEVDLADYAKTTDVTAALATKVDVDANARLMTNNEGEKLAGIEDGAQVNIIDSVSSDFNIVTDAASGLKKQLQLRTLTIEKINGLQDALDSKVNAQEGYTLLSPSDKEKLNALTIGESGLEISGTVNAANVQGLADWITDHQSTVDGLSENNFTDSLKTKLQNALSIKSINTNQLQLSNDGELSIKAVDPALVTGLVEALSAKANRSELIELQSSLSTVQGDVNNLNLSVSQIGATLGQLTKTVNSNTTKINDLDARLTWQEIASLT